MKRKKTRFKKKISHNYYTKKYPSNRAREAARQLLFDSKKDDKNN